MPRKGQRNPGRSERLARRLRRQALESAQQNVESIEPANRSPSNFPTSVRAFPTASASNETMDAASSSSSNAIGTALQLAQAAIQANNKNFQETVQKNNEIFRSFLETVTADSAIDNRPNTTANQNKTHKLPPKPSNINHPVMLPTNRAFNRGPAQYSDNVRRRSDNYRPVYDDAWLPHGVHHGRVDKATRFASSPRSRHISQQDIFNAHPSLASHKGLQGPASSSILEPVTKDPDGASYQLPLDTDKDTEGYDDKSHESLEVERAVADTRTDRQTRSLAPRLRQTEHVDDQLEKEIAQGLAWISDEDEGEVKG
ncbi:hypothetical protein ABW21_db0206071 [Orbilia brochopaga]|nr:hypothetical protein ABW21_db0206071 [Drechslerella brochopaga]